MFEKIPSIRDFIIYVVPGTLLNIITLALLFEFKLIKAPITLAALLESNTFVFSFILFSFLIGFVQSQLQIILINKFIYRYAKDFRKLENTSLPDDVKKAIVFKIKKDFKLHSLSEHQIRNDSQLLYLCFSKVLLIKNSYIIQNLNRNSYLSLFAGSVILPVILGYYYVSLKVEIILWLKLLIFVSLGTITIYICIKAVRIFRSEWVTAIYKFFLLYSEPN